MKIKILCSPIFIVNRNLVFQELLNNLAVVQKIEQTSLSSKAISFISQLETQQLEQIQTAQAKQILKKIALIQLINNFPIPGAGPTKLALHNLLDETQILLKKFILSY